MALGGFVAACGTKGTSKGSAPASARAAADTSDTDKLVNWSNWPEYIDVNDKTKARPTLAAFTAATGIRVTYTEDYNDNDEFFAKVKPQLAAGQDTGRDVWCSTDWMVARLIRLGWVQELDKANIPNAVNLEPDLQNVEYDKGRKYSLPWQSGFTGIAYNPKSTGGKKVESIDQLLTDKSLKGKVTLLTEMRDTVGLVMLAQGKDPASFTDADFDAAIAELTTAKNSGQLRGFTGNEYGKPLASGDTAACMAWTGDVVQLQADNPKLGYVLPSTGHMLWSDNFVIPNQAKHKKNAERLMNYYYDPKVMATVEDYVNYIAPVKGAKEALLASDASVAKNPLIFPSAEVLAQSHVFKGLSEADETKYNKKFQALIGA
ncbi:MAG: spermidine/putrescine transport system substrate-binding protein [Actinomycetota bacterium]|nr:spermidine/putrescine transport system substrate-binding protein [Actinomycetota bacterium]